MFEFELEIVLVGVCVLVLVVLSPCRCLFCVFVFRCLSRCCVLVGDCVGVLV